MATAAPKGKTRTHARKKSTATTANLNVRSLDPRVKATIQQLAARHGRSMEAEVRDILTRSVQEDEAPDTLNPLSGAALLARLAVLREALGGETPEFDTSFLGTSEGH